jgi:CTP:molybdopterin cytidylyltransferase MocA
MGAPKALLHYRGRTFLECCLGALQGTCRKIVVVVGPGFNPDGQPSAIHWIQNTDWERGPFSSLQLACRYLMSANEVCGAMIVLPVDHPAVQPETVGALADALTGAEFARATFTGDSVGAAGPAIVKPICGGSSGHPVLYAARTFNAICSADAAATTARDIQAQFAKQTALVAVTDAGIHVNVDTPEDYAKLLGS